MNLGQLRAEFRRVAKDTAIPYKWADTDVDAWLNEGEREACIRARLLFDKTTQAYCEIVVTTAAREYAVDAKVAEIVTAQLEDAGGEFHPLRILTREWLDHQAPTWRMDDARRPDAITHYDQHIEFNVLPDAAYTLHLETYRLPAVDMAADGDTPEIGSFHHEHLVKWALYRAYGIQDADTYDKDAEARYLGEFEVYFGTRPGAQLRKQQNAEAPRARPNWC